jgi:hypothetical protein
MLCPSRMAPALLLVAILATPAVLANPLGEAHFQRSVILASGPMDSIAQLWHLLVRVWRKNGLQIDPSGAQNGGQAGPKGIQTKNGPQIDPSGNSLQPPAPNPESNPLTSPHG